MTVYPLVLVLLAGTALGKDDNSGGGGLLGGGLRGLAEPRLAVNAIRIHQLEQHIEKLKTRLKEASLVDPHAFAEELSARLGHIEGTHCEDNEFQCGSNDQECISDLFMCDGHKDCHNGHDEEEDVCSTAPVKSGNEFTGITHWKACSLQDDHVTHVKITGTKRFKFFAARVAVQAVVTSVIKDKDGEHTKKYEMKGGYNFSNRRLSLFPTDDGLGHLGLRCEFNHGDDERADCTLITAASLFECADLNLSLEHHDDNHH